MSEREKMIADGLRAVGKGLSGIIVGVSRFAEASGDVKGARVLVAVSRVVGKPLHVAAEALSGKPMEAVAVGLSMIEAIDNVRRAVRGLDGVPEGTPEGVERG